MCGHHSLKSVLGKSEHNLAKMQLVYKKLGNSSVHFCQLTTVEVVEEEAVLTVGLREHIVLHQGHRTEPCLMEPCSCTAGDTFDTKPCMCVFCGCHSFPDVDCPTNGLIQVKLEKLLSFPSHEQLVEWYEGTITRLAWKIRNRNRTLGITTREKTQNFTYKNRYPASLKVDRQFKLCKNVLMWHCEKNPIFKKTVTHNFIAAGRRVHALKLVQRLPIVQLKPAQAELRS